MPVWTLILSTSLAQLHNLTEQLLDYFKSKINERRDYYDSTIMQRLYLKFKLHCYALVFYQLLLPVILSYLKLEVYLQKFCYLTLFLLPNSYANIF